MANEDLESRDEVKANWASCRAIETQRILDGLGIEEVPVDRSLGNTSKSGAHLQNSVYNPMMNIY